MSKKGKRYRALLEKVDLTKQYTISEAVALAKECATAKFDEMFSTKHQKFQETIKDYQESTKDGIFSPNDPSKFVQETNNNTVAKVDTKIVAQEPVNKEEKVQKDNFDRSFEEFEKEFDKKWKNF